MSFAEEIIKTLYEFGPQPQEVVGKTYSECGYCDHTLPEHYSFCVWLAIKNHVEWKRRINEQERLLSEDLSEAGRDG